jgi:hypothetical protein
VVSYVLGQKDTLAEEVVKFAQQPLTAPCFLNSVPKSGTHLLMNIVRMFVPVEQQWQGEFIQFPNLKASMRAFNYDKVSLSWGHLLFSDISAMALRYTRHVVLVRDPYDWVMARARFYLSDEFQGSLNHIKTGTVAAGDVLNMMIVGVHEKAPSLLDIFTFNAAAWMGTHAKIYRYEDILANLKRLDTPEAEAFFHGLLADCGIEQVPADWRERVLIGSDRKRSRTARENLKVAIELPDELPAAQKRLVDFAAPGLRELLGYA